MQEYIFSNHALEQMQNRSISATIVTEVLNNPKQVIIEEEKKIYQSIINFEEEGKYLVRIFINTMKEPNVIITVYRTSKIGKYYES